MRFREKLARFMYGRYGLDEFGRFLLYSSLVILLVSSLLQLSVLYFIALFELIFSYFRIFSKNIYKRSSENRKYLDIKSRVCSFFGRIFSGLGIKRDRYNSRCNSYSGSVYEQQYKVFKCPNCKQKLRVPKGKGKIQISCRRCGNTFIKRT